MCVCFGSVQWRAIYLMICRCVNYRCKPHCSTGTLKIIQPVTKSFLHLKETNTQKHNTMTPPWMDILSFVPYCDLRHVFVSAGLTFSGIRLHLHQIWCCGRSTGCFIHFQWGPVWCPKRSSACCSWKGREQLNFLWQSCHSAAANHLFQLTRIQHSKPTTCCHTTAPDMLMKWDSCGCTTSQHFIRPSSKL